MQSMSSENKTDIRKALVHSVGNMFLFHHTAAKSNKRIGILMLEVFQSSYITENSVLSVLSYSAGVKENKVGVIGLVLKNKSRGFKHTFYPFAIGNILLTAVGTDKRYRFFAAFSALHNLIY